MSKKEKLYKMVVCRRCGWFDRAGRFSDGDEAMIHLYEGMCPECGQLERWISTHGNFSISIMRFVRDKPLSISNPKTWLSYKWVIHED